MTHVLTPPIGVEQLTHPVYTGLSRGDLGCVADFCTDVGPARRQRQYRAAWLCRHGGHSTACRHVASRNTPSPPPPPPHTHARTHARTARLGPALHLAMLSVLLVCAIMQPAVSYSVLFCAREVYMPLGSAGNRRSVSTDPCDAYPTAARVLPGRAGARAWPS